jgi:hypothetical protein
MRKNRIASIILLAFILVLPSVAEEKKQRSQNDFRVSDAASLSEFFSWFSLPATRFLGWDDHFVYISRPSELTASKPVHEQLPFGPIVRISRNRVDYESLVISLQYKTICIGYEDIVQSPPCAEYSKWTSECVRQGEMWPPAKPDLGLIEESFARNRQK